MLLVTLVTAACAHDGLADEPIGASSVAYLTSWKASTSGQQPPAGCAYHQVTTRMTLAEKNIHAAFDFYAPRLQSTDKK